MNSDTVELPLSTCRDVALQIIDSLPADEFCSLAEEIKRRARLRAFDALETMRLAAKRANFKKKDFTDALKEVRAHRKKTHAHSRA